jgi:hypothetical protein
LVSISKREEEMWVFTNKAFLSIVEFPGEEEILWVRARFPGHIEAAFPGFQVRETPECDYRYRAAVDRDAVGRWLTREVREVRYANFKQSIGENFYHDACLSVWTEMFIWSKKLMGILKPMRAA